MLGEFSLRAGDTVLSDAGNRAKKVWGLLACLLCHRDRVLTQQRLIELLWEDDASSTNPENAFRITLHRLRTLLDGLWPGAGRELILRREGGYIWTDQVSMAMDFERFDDLCRRDDFTEEEQLARYLEALSLYQGDFLPRQSSEMWVVPVSTHFHNQYLLTVLDTVRLLSARGRHGEAVDICRTAAAAEPYHELLHQLLMQELAALGDP